MNRMVKASLVVAFAFVCGSAVAQSRWSAADKGAFTEIRNDGGRTLGYNQDSGLKIIEVDGYAFKDLNRNGELDAYEDWRRPSKERAADLQFVALNSPSKHFIAKDYL